MKDKTKLDELRESQQTIDSAHVSCKGNSIATCYIVQARMCRGCGPRSLPGQGKGWFRDEFLTDSKWQTVHFSEAPIGVPPSRFNEEYSRHGFYDYAAAQALRWWFIAEMQKGIGSIETRLVKCKFEYTYSAEPVEIVCVVDPEEREDIMPDWGKSAPPATKENK